MKLTEINIKAFIGQYVISIFFFSQQLKPSDVEIMEMNKRHTELAKEDANKIITVTLSVSFLFDILFYLIFLL